MHEGDQSQGRLRLPLRPGLRVTRGQRNGEAERRRQPREPRPRDPGLRERAERHFDRVQAGSVVSEEIGNRGNATTESRRLEEEIATKARNTNCYGSLLPKNSTVAAGFSGVNAIVTTSVSG